MSTLQEMFPGRLGVTTEEAALLLDRRPQTLRKWASLQNGPIQPVRVGARLQWRLVDLQRLIG